MSIAVDSFNAAAVIDRACTSKHEYTTPGESRAAAREASRRSGDIIRSYRCPFGDGCRRHAHWHIGRVPSIASLEHIARAIRESHQQPHHEQVAS